MSGGTIAALVVAILVVAAVVIALAVMPALRRRKLRDRFGPEYERTLAQTGNRREAESELADREKRHDKLELRDLSPQARDGYARDWRQVQETFVDAPEKAAGEADSLVTAVMAERGYPTGDYEQQAADLSVEHASTLEHYRAAHLVIAGHQPGTSTEELRVAMIRYRTVFEDLIGTDVPRADLSDAGVSDASRSDASPAAPPVQTDDDRVGHGTGGTGRGEYPDGRADRPRD